MDFDQSSKQIFLLVKCDNKIYSMHLRGPRHLRARRAPLPALGPRPGAARTSRSTTPPEPPPKTSTTRPTATRSSATRRPGGAAGIRPRTRREVRRRGRQRRPPLDRKLQHPQNGRVRTDRRRPDQNRRRQRHRIALPDQVRPLEQRHVRPAVFGGQGAIRYTAASGYAPGSAQVFDTTTNATVAINATRHVVYVAGSPRSPPTTRRRGRCSRPSAKKAAVDQRHRGRRRDRHRLPLARLHEQDPGMEGHRRPRRDHRRTDRQLAGVGLGGPRRRRRSHQLQIRIRRNHRLRAGRALLTQRPPTRRIRPWSPRN